MTTLTTAGPSVGNAPPPWSFATVVRERSRLQRYGMAALAVALALLARFPLAPVLGEAVPFLLFFPAVMLAAWFGGIGPGLVATAASMLTTFAFIVEPLGQPLPESSGEAVAGGLFCAVGAVISGLTEGLHRARRRSEAAVLESERLAVQLAGERRRLANLVATVPGVVWEAWGSPDAASQRIDFVSEHVREMLGYSVEEWLATPNFWLSIVHPDDREEAARRAAETFATGGGANRFRWVAKDGRIVWVEAQATVIRDPDGNPAGLRGVTIDVSERRQAEEERASLLAAAEQARRQAEEASRTKDEFLATLSHELRTPLNAILGWAQILRMKPAPEEDLEKGLAAIVRNSRLQAQLVDDLIDVSRIVTGQMRLDVRPVDLVPVVEAAIESVRPAADAKEIRLERVFDPLGPVLGDPARLQQVVWNLLSNAIKFTPRQGRVQVQVGRLNSHVEIAVSDTGSGIETAFLPYVFERFRQSDSSTRRRHGGLGLGLAIVRHLVELHGGTVRAESPGPGQGATFVVSLPVALAPPPPGS